MSQAKSKRVSRVEMYHDLSVELCRIEIEMENQDEKDIDQTLLAKRAKLQSAIKHLAI
ncbi:MAG: hypothetical protein AAGB27_16250 [Pseudomonadota bacterium]